MKLSVVTSNRCSVLQMVWLTVTFPRSVEDQKSIQKSRGSGGGRPGPGRPRIPLPQTDSASRERVNQQGEATFETTVALQGYCFFHFQVPINHRDRAIQSCKPGPTAEEGKSWLVTVTGKSSRSVCVPASWSWQGAGSPPCGFVLCHFPGGFNSVLRCQLRS